METKSQTWGTVNKYVDILGPYFNVLSNIGGKEVFRNKPKLEQSIMGRNRRRKIKVVFDKWEKPKVTDLFT